MQLSVYLQLALVLPACLSPHHYICVGSWPPLLHRSLLLAITAKHMYTTSSSHYYYLFWFLATGPGGNVEYPKGPCRLYGIPCSIHQGPCSCQCCGPQQPESMSHYTWTYCYHKRLYLVPSLIRPQVTAHSRVLLLLLKLINEVWKRWLLLQMHRLRCKTIEIIRNHGNRIPPKEYKKSPVTGPDKKEIWNFLTKNSK